MNATHSTYSLVERSRVEEKGRTRLEVVIFTMSILSVAVSIFQFAQQRIVVPAAGLTPCIACAAKTPVTQG